MDPYDEERLRNEVIYLHSLWHQGPPQNPIPFPTFPSSSSSHRPFFPQPLLDPHFDPPPWRLPRHQQPPPPRTVYPPAPAHTTAFKKSKNKKKKKKKNRAKIPDPGPEWPCPASPDPKPTTGWGSSKPHSDPPPAVSPEEKERLAALQAQHKACKVFREFLCASEDDDEEEEEDDDDDGELEELFVGVFMEDDELRRYYQKYFENGDFSCLVCGAVGKKNSGKKFKDCVGLVQHSMSVLRGVRRRAHRAFGQAVCKVLGWDIDRLPTIVMKGEPLGCSAQAESEPKENVAADDDRQGGSDKSDDEVVPLEHGDEPDEEHAQGCDHNISGCSSKESDMLDIELENGGGGGKNEGEPEEKIDDHDKDSIHKSDDKVVSFGHGDEPDEEHACGVDQSTSECSSKEGDPHNTAENL
ncbi:uncharacterized protein LOC130748723 isoform X2 [Lotus japonicus]|uniref:uncharacterized protein LOC130748723 isoform X2 n=1 Tax=Lotus japonicus TaxID=34305 RepID=UPI00258415ED|nr:uncharacterized protein LOC130748723 isoform X2 [Lotus japonicus]